MQKTRLMTSPLGSTGLEITRVGFGAWAIGGGGWEFARSPGPCATRAVDGAIAGFRRPAQAGPILAAAGLELTGQDMTEIEG